MTTPSERILSLLPQTQCRQCGYSGCAPYAAAISEKAADINRCPPGGPALIDRLSELTGRPVISLDSACGEYKHLRKAWIDPALCIGCTLCIQACPVDAIVGAARLMHVVIGDQCTGCELCVSPCPMDCIQMQLPDQQREWTQGDANSARQRHEAKYMRLNQLKTERIERAERRILWASQVDPLATEKCELKENERRRVLVEAALQRVRERRSTSAKPGQAAS